MGRMAEIFDSLHLAVEQLELRNEQAIEEANKYVNKRIQAYTLYDYIESSENQVMFISGLRKIGKTIILQQLNAHYNKIGKKSIYIDMTIANDLVDDICKWVFLFDVLYEIGYKYIFLDEACKATQYNRLVSDIKNSSGKMKFIVTGSSSVHIEKMCDSVGRGGLIKATNWTLLEKIIFSMGNPTDLNVNPYKYNNIDEMRSSIKGLATEEAIYSQYTNYLYDLILPYTENSDWYSSTVQLIKSQIDDTIESNRANGRYSRIDDIKSEDIQGALKLISYNMIIDMNNNTSLIGSRNIFGDCKIIYEFITNESIELNDLLRKIDIDKIGLEYLSDLKKYSKQNLLNIIEYLRDIDLVKIGYDDLDTVSSNNDNYELNRMTVYSNHHLLTKTIYIDIISTLLYELGVPSHHINSTLIQVMTNEKLNLKGNLVEGLIYSTLSALISDNTVAKYRTSSGIEEVDIIFKDVTDLGIIDISNKICFEVKNRKVKKVMPFIPKFSKLVDKLKVDKGIITTDSMISNYNTEFINVVIVPNCILLMYLESQFVYNKIPTVKLCSTI